MIEIMKASAGSGKTYNLAKTYIRLLLSSDDRTKYRHILAVTFTNKATSEMKSRILKELHILSKTPRESNYYNDFVPSLFPDGESLGRRALSCLVGILHDYSAFSVSTIDKFFQLALKAFSREIGYFSSYQVELDTKSLIAEAVDRMLDSLTREDKEILGWIIDGVGEDLESGKKVRLEKKLIETGERLKSTEHASLCEKSGMGRDVYSKENIRAVSEEFRHFAHSFEEGIAALCKRAVSVIGSAGLDAASFSRSWVQPLYGWADGSLRKPFSDAMLATMADPSRWFKKADAPRLLPSVEGPLSEVLASLAGAYNDGLKAYRTASILLPSLHTLGLAKEFFDAFDNLVSEKNIMSLDDSNTILRRIIDGSGTPFIYEKIGVRYENFLLDEFQDTSAVQWANFMPLLKESDDNGRDNLVVGDVKQSIYRFRGSDWGLLDRELPAAFPRSIITPLSDNYRSLPEVVGFNNSFFNFVASRMDPKIGEIYSSVHQDSHDSEAQKGHVGIRFCEEDEEEIGAVVSSIEDAMSRGAACRDIAVLVRNHIDGAAVATALISKGLPVISDDSLLVKSSITVRRLTALLSAIENPQDAISSFLSQSTGLPEKLNDTTLVDLCEDILRLLRRDDDSSFEGEVLHIQSFMDNLQEWTVTNGNDLKAFLEFWEDANPKITSPEDADAISIMTVHKSKGLEFPCVIVPFAEKIGKKISSDNYHWCFLDAEGTPFSKRASMLYPVNITSARLKNTYLEQELERDVLYSAVDDINLAYVAFTRAGKSLEIISAEPSSSDSTSLAAHLKAYVEMTGCSSFGEEYRFSPVARVDSEEAFLVDYFSVPLGDRLDFSADASDYFSEDGLVGAGASARLWGIACHEILSRVIVPEDIEEAVKQSVLFGDISREDAALVKAFLSKRISSHPEWFSGGTVRNEQSVIDCLDGSFNRPDRVILKGEEVLIVDFKFGEARSSYTSQVRRYMELYHRMGYSSVRGFLWYVEKDKVEEIECSGKVFV